MVLKIVVDNTQAKRELGEFSRATTSTATKVERSGKRIETANKRAAGSVKALRLSMVKVGVAVGAITAVAFAIDRLAKQADNVANLGRAFDTLTARIDTTASSMLPKMREATKGLVDDMELQRQANQAIILGVAESADQYANLIKNAVILGKSLGIDTTRAIESVTTGIGRQSIRWLDNLGIVFSVDDANAEYAKTLGIEAAALDDAQRKQAFLDKAMRESSRAVEGLTLEVDTLAGKWNQAAVATKNYSNSVLKGLNELPRTIGADIEAAGGFLSFLDLQGMTPEQSDARAQREATAVTASEASKHAQNALRKMNETAQALAATQLAIRDGLTEEVFLRNQAWDVMLEQHQTARDIARLVGEPTGRTDIALRPDAGPGPQNEDMMIASATAADKELHDTLAENFDFFLQGQQDREIASIETALELKLARIITGEEVITAVMMEALANRHIMEGELTDEQLARIEQARADSAARINAISGGVATTGTQFAKLEADQKAKIATRGAAMALGAAQQAFGANKGLQMGQAVVNTAGAIMNAMANIPAPANFVIAALTGAMGAAQLATIQKTEFKGAARGTIITGGTAGIDSVPYNLMRGEAVLPAGLTAFLQQAAARTGATAGSEQGGIVSDSGGGGNIIIIEGGGLPPGEWRRQAEDDPDGFMSAMRNAIAVGA